MPDIKTTDALKAAVLAADLLVYNTASTGIYLENLFNKLGVGEQIKAKTTRHANGEAVMEHVIKGKGKEIGFGAITEIKLYEVKGALKLVGAAAGRRAELYELWRRADEQFAVARRRQGVPGVPRHAGRQAGVRVGGDRVGATTPAAARRPLARPGRAAGPDARR